MFDLNEHQLGWIVNHMGHTLDVHKIHYRQTSSLIERIDIAKVMVLQENNLISKCAGKKLSEINLEGENYSMFFAKYIALTLE